MAEQVPTATSRVPDDPLQAILLADSFDQKFHPITLERPKVLLPLKNRPMIDYTLSWLESEGVDEVYVFCCAHSDQIIAYLDKSGWFTTPNFRVTTIESHNAVSVGDALRLIHKRNVIHGDFVLIGGDNVTNISLKEAIQAHKDNRNTDNSAIMTMLIEESSLSVITRESCLGICEKHVAIDPHTKQLLYYDPYPKHGGDYRNACRYLRKKLLVDKPYVHIHQTKQDCRIDICSPQLLSLFTDNIDCQHPRGHLIKRLLEDDMTGYKIFTHEIKFTSAKRVDNFRSYDSISKSIYQSLPDRMLGVSALKEAPVMIKSQSSAQIDCCCVIGKGTSIGNHTKVAGSVIGQGCVIGSDVSIQDCYIWNNVVIEDGCKLKHALICDGAILKSGAVLNPGVVLSFNVVVGQGFVVPAYSKVSLLQQPIKQDGDKELKQADNNIALTPTTNELCGVFASLLPNSPSHAASEVGAGGIGYVWSVCGHSREEERRHSVAPLPSNEVRRLMCKSKDDIDFQEHVYHKRRPFRLHVSAPRAVIVSNLPRRLKSRSLKKLTVTLPRVLPGRRALTVSIFPRRSKNRSLKKLTRVTRRRFLPGRLRRQNACCLGNEVTRALIRV